MITETKAVDVLLHEMDVAHDEDVTDRSTSAIQNVTNIAKAMQEVVDDTRRCLDARNPDEIRHIRERTRQHLSLLDEIVVKLT